MVLNINKYFFHYIFLFLLLFLISCTAQTKDFNLSGRLVLYSSNVDEKSELILLNIDTNQELVLPFFEEIGRSGYLLFDNGKKILVDSYSSLGNLYVYEIINREKTKIDLDKVNNEIYGFFNASIRKDTLYFSGGEKLYIYSLPEFNKISELSFNFNISQFAVYNNNLAAITYSSFDYESKGLTLSNIYFYNLEKKNILDSLFSGGFQLKWSNDETNLFFVKGSYQPTIVHFPSLQQIPLTIEGDSLKYYREMFFIDNENIILTCYLKDKDENASDLYLYGIKENKILRKLTNTNTLKEIKSSFYK